MTRTRRVAVVTPRYPPDVGGVENYAERSVRVLRASGRYDVLVVTTGRSRRSSVTWADGVPVVRLGVWARLSNTPVNPLWPAQLRRLLRRWRIDVVWAHSPVPLLADCARLAAGRRPFVLTYHAGSLVKGGARVDPLLRAYERWVLPRLFRATRALVSVSPVALSRHTQRDVVIPPGVDLTGVVPGTDSRDRSLLYVGRVESTSRWKGLRVLVEALPTVAAAVPDVMLDVVGDGDDRPHLVALAERLGVASRIRWHGALPQGDTWAHYRCATALVLPSLTESESFGMTLIEAMACATPVVASRVGGPAFVVRDGTDGLLVTPGDAAELAAACTRLLADDVTARRLGAAGRLAAEERWDWRHRDSQLLEVVDALAG